MKKFLRNALALTLIAGFVTACGKYDEGPGFSLRSKTARLSGSWDVVDVSNGYDIDDYDEFSFEFEKNGDFEISVGYSYYGYSEFFVEKGEWEFSSDKEELELDYDGGGNVDFEIKRLTNKELIIEDEDGIEYELEKQ